MPDVGVGWKAGRGPTVLFALNPDGTPPLDLGPMGIAVLDDRERVIARSLCMLGDQAVIPFVADEGFVVRSYLVQPVRRAEPSPAPTQLKPAGTGDRRRGSSRLSIGVIAAAMLAARG